MSKSSGLTHILTELSQLDELYVLVNRSTRLKHTCVAVSRKYIALGSNTGGIYIFSRDTLKYLQVVFADSEASQVVCVSLSPSDQYVGFALSTGLVAVYDVNIEKRTKPERVRLTQEHVGNSVKSLAWDSFSSKLFVGDDVGKLSIVFLPSIKGKTLFSGPSEVIAYLDASIYQMEWWNDKLLVTTLSHTHLFDNIKHNYSTIGTKSRDGEFGSCYFLEPSTQVPVIYCARPGSRMWEVDFSGKVLHTHQFKQLLATPPVPVIELVRDQVDLVVSAKASSQSVNFLKMWRISQFIVTWSLRGIYIFDPINVKVVVWTQSIKGIKDICVVNNDLYIFLENGLLQKLTLLPIYQLFTILSTRKKWSLMSSLLLSADQLVIHPAIMKRVKQDLLKGLVSGLKEEGKADRAEKVLASMEDLSESSIDSMSLFDDFMDSADVLGHTYLPSGMVVVSEGVQIRGVSPKLVETSGQKVNDKSEQSRTGSDADIRSEGSLSGAMEKEFVDSGTVPTIQNMTLYVKKEEDDHQTYAGGTDILNRHHDRSASVDSIGSESDYTVVNGEKTIMLDSNDNIQFDSNDNVQFDSNDNIQFDRNDNVQFDSNDNVQFDSNDNVQFDSNDNVHLVHEDFPEVDVTLSREPDQSVVSTPGIPEVSEVICAEPVEKSLWIRTDNTEGVIKTKGHSTDIPSSPTSPNMILTNLTSTTNVENKITFSDMALADLREHSVAHDGSGTDLCLLTDSVCAEQSMSPSTLPVPSSPRESSQSNSNSYDEPLKQSDYVTNEVSETKRAVEGSLSVKQTKPTTIDKNKMPHRYSRIEIDSSVGELIAQPIKPGKKKKTRSASERKTKVDSIGSQRGGTVSVGDEPEESLFDTVSISTISSMEEDDDVILTGGAVTPDSLSSAGDLAPDPSSTKSSIELSVSPPRCKEKPFRKSSAPVDFRREKVEVIPPLVDRLAAARGQYVSDESPPSHSPLSGSGEHNSPVTGSPRASLSTFSDGLSHIKSHTKSFIKTFKEKNIRMSKSNSSPMLTSLANQQTLSNSLSLKPSHEHLNVSSCPDEAPSSGMPRKKPLSVEEEVAAALDLSSLYRTAREVQKNLGDPVTLLKPRLTLRILNEWARELNGVMLEYHKALSARGFPNASVKIGNPVEENARESCNQPVNDSGHVSKSIDRADGAHSTETEREVTLKDSENIIFANHTDEPIGSVDLKPSYWTKVIHSKDVFKILPEEFDVIQSLTTLCFITGATGNILNFLGLFEKSLQFDLVKSILPQHILAFLSPTSTSFIPHQSKCGNSNKGETAQGGQSEIVPGAKLKKDLRPEGVDDCEETINSKENDCTGAAARENPRTSAESDLIMENLCHSLDLQQDLSLALFTRLYFFILDYGKIKLKMDEQGTRLFLTWVSALQCSIDIGNHDIVGGMLSDKQTSSAIDYLRSGILPRQSAYLGHIYRLFELVPAKASEFCGELNKKVSPADLLNICSMCNKPAAGFLMKYIKHWMLSLAQYHRKLAFSQICENRDVRYLTLESLIPALSLDTTPTDNSKISGSQIVSVLPLDWLDLLLSKMGSEDEREDVVNLSIKFGFWPLTIKLLTNSNQWQRLLKIILDIGEIKFLKGKHGEDAYIPQNLDQWKYLLQQFESKQAKETSKHKTQSSNKDIKASSIQDVSQTSTGPESAAQTAEVVELSQQQGCYESFSRQDSYQWEAISWGSLGYLLLHHVGGALTLDLLMEHLQDPCVAQDCLSTEFLYACFMDYKIKLKQDHMTHEMLEKLTAYMWTKKPGFVPPVVFHAINKEKAAGETGAEDSHTLYGLFSYVQSLDSHKLMSEHVAGHWGQEVNIASPCLVCNVPLKSVMSLSEQGVIIFPCSHAFHRCCVRSSVCPVLH